MDKEWEKLEKLPAWQLTKVKSNKEVLTEQASSASQMTAVKVMEVIARLPGCAGQAADAVSAHTQVRMKDAPKKQKLKNPKSECLLRHKWPKSWSNIEDPVVPLERNVYGHPLAGLLRERQFEDVLLELGLAKVPNWECQFVHRKQWLFSSLYVDGIKMVGKKAAYESCVEETDETGRSLDEPTPFLDHVYLGCTQRECQAERNYYCAARNVL